MKREALNHSKIKRLTRELQLEPWGAVGILESLWHLTAREAPEGNIGKLPNQDIAACIGWSSDANQLVNALITCRWIDVSDEHRLVIHDWSDHADDGVHQKLAKALKFFADGKVPNLSKIPKTERVKFEKEYERLKALKSPNERLKAPKSPNERLKDLTKPSLAKPSQSLALTMPPDDECECEFPEVNSLDEPSDDLPASARHPEEAQTAQRAAKGKLFTIDPTSPNTGPSEISEAAFPLTTTAVRKRFPLASWTIIQKIIQNSFKHCKITDDSEIAEAINATAHNADVSPGFFKTSVPDWILKKRAGASQDLGEADSAGSYAATNRISKLQSKPPQSVTYPHTAVTPEQLKTMREMREAQAKREVI